MYKDSFVDINESHISGLKKSLSTALNLLLNKIIASRLINGLTSISKS